MHPVIKARIISLARATPDREVCGFIYHRCTGESLLLPCANVAADPAHSFQIGRDDHLRAVSSGHLLGVYHSHPTIPGFSTGTPDCDLERAGAIALPFYLYTIATDTWHDYWPPTYRPPLAGRDWVTGIEDCYQTVRLYYRQHHGVHLGDYDRDDQPATNVRDLILARFAAEGFERVGEGLTGAAAARIGDVLMFQSDRLLSNHFGVLTGPSVILHHLKGGLSATETLTDRWLARVVCVFRYSGGPTGSGT